MRIAFHRHLDLRGGHRIGQLVQHLRRSLHAPGQDLQQARGRVQAVIEAVPALAEEEVAAHLAGQFGLGLAHLGLDQRVPGLPHQRAAALAQDVVGQLAGALDVVDHHGARIALQHIGGEQHQQPVREHHLAFLGHHAQAVAVAVEGQAQVGVEALDHLHQVLEVVRLARVRVVVGEAAVDLAVQRDHLGADGLQQARGDVAGNTIAGVDHHLQRPLHLHVVGDAADVVFVHRLLDQRTGAAARLQAAFADALAQVLDRVAGQGLATDHDLEAVVVGRIVAAGHRHAAAGAQVVGGEIHHRSGHHAHVDHVAAGLAQALDQAAGQLRAGQAAIAADHDVGQALVGHHVAHRLADPGGDLRGQFTADHAADVIGAEDARLQRDLRRHGRGPHRCHRRAGLVLAGLQGLAQGRLGFLQRAGGRLAAQLRQLAARQQYGQRRQCGQHGRGDQAGDGTQSERATAHIRNRGRHAQAGLADVAREHVGEVGQAGITALDQVEPALAQRQVGPGRQRRLLHGGGQLGQRQAHVGHRRQAAQPGRCRHAQPRGTFLAHQHGHRLALVGGLFQQAQACETEFGGVGVGGRQIGGQDQGALGATPALAQGLRGGTGVAGGQGGLDFGTVQLPRQGGGPVRQHRPHGLGHLVARAAQLRLAGVATPLLHAAPQEPRRQHAQQRRQQQGATLDLVLRYPHRIHLDHPVLIPFNVRRCGRSRLRHGRCRQKYPPPSTSHARSVPAPAGRCGRRAGW